MYPTLFRIGPISIHSYGLMMATGFLLALVVWRRLPAKNISADRLNSLLVWLLVPGIIGARLFYVVEHWRDFLAAPWAVIRMDQGGLVFYGGALGACAGLLVFARRHRQSVIELMDLVAVALPLGHALGRIGCWLNGCCHGRPSESPWSISFPYGSHAWSRQVALGQISQAAIRSQPVLPVQLFEAAGNLLIFFLLFRLYPARRFRGMVCGAYLVLYPLLRFFLEPMRGDERFTGGPLSIGQILSIMFVLGGIAILALGRRPAAGVCNRGRP